MPPLESLGRRIMICGPSNSGKSTLAVAIGNRIGLPAIHLDRFRHQPNTNYVPRPDAEFLALHDEAILGEAWVMDGNYSSLFPQRIARATGIILLGHHRLPTFVRYLNRTLFQKNRAGALEGSMDSIKWDMIHWILVVSPRNLKTYRRTLPAAGLPYVETMGMGELNGLYAHWDLARP